MKKIKIDLAIEKGDGNLWGSINYNQNMIADYGNDITDLESKLKKLLYEWENIDPNLVEFEHTYHVYALFEQFDFLNISKIAERADINPGLLRQYASGVKNPSQKQAKKIEETIHRLADEMKKMTIYTVA